MQGALPSLDWLHDPPPLASLAGGPEQARIGNIRIGTASWTDRTLLASRTFYPPAANTPERRLRYYARHFGVVEVDASYYALPTSAQARAWVERTPSDFLFGVKAYAAMTGHPVELSRLDRDLHQQLPQNLRAARSVYARDLPSDVVREIWRRFRAALDPLHVAGKLGYVLLQMPKWFPPTHESRADLERAAEWLGPLPVAVEFRQAGWMADERRDRTLAFLRATGLVYVSVDEPQGTPASVPPLAEATSEELSIVRFHGRKQATWNKPGVSTTERFGYLYRKDELAEWLGKIRDLAGKSRQVHVLMNNCHRHHAVQNAKDLAVLLESG